MLQPLVTAEFSQIFDIMSQSFPSTEHRSYDEQKALLDEHCYKILTHRLSGRIAAFLAIWDFNEFIYIEHFATHPDYRNMGYGTHMLRELISLSNKPICLEVEPPEDEITCRRIEFYKRNGLYLNGYPYIQPPISKGKKAIPLMIMTSPRQVSQEEFNIIKSKLYKEVYKQ